MAPLPANIERFTFEVAELDQELRVSRFEAREGLSQLFQVTLDLACEDSEIDFDQVVGKPAVLEILGDSEEPRYINGIVNRFEQLAVGLRFSLYRATLVPKLWYLAHRRNCRIFPPMTTQAIIDKVLQDAGLPADEFLFAIEGETQTREYCVQYRESELNFISRLMEEEGIFYFFSHVYDKHLLVMGNGSSAHQPIPGEPTVHFQESRFGEVADTEHVYSFVFRQQVRPGTVTLRDYDFKKPTLLPEGKATGEKNTALEIYDYPGLFEAPTPAKDLAQVRLEEYRSTVQTGHGMGTCSRLCPGFKFTLADHPRESFNAEYLVSAMRHTGSQPQVLEQQASARGTEFSTTFECLPATIPYRPPRITPKPVVEGAQTAIVVGPSGEEIYTDDDGHGRVKVQFHWDREGQMNEKSSCWIRVSQGWAGNLWGALYLPRIGQEVIIDFLEGDPDRPIITGRVYHGTNRPPYPLPAEKTKSTLKSDSTKDGGGFNEIRFEDKKREEQIFVHAEKNQDIRVKNDCMEWIGHDRHLIVKRNQHELVEEDEHLEVKGDMTETVRGDNNRYVQGDDLHGVDASQHLSVARDQMEKIGADRNLSVAMNDNNKVGMKYSLQAGTDIHAKAGMNAALESGMNVHIKGGMNVVVEAGLQLTLKAGAGFVTIGPAGVDIQGPMIKLNSGGAAGSGSGASPTAPVSPDPVAKPEEPKVADEGKPGKKVELRKAKVTPVKPVEFSPAALVLKEAAKSGTPFCEKCAEAAAAKASKE